MLSFNNLQFNFHTYARVCIFAAQGEPDRQFILPVLSFFNRKLNKIANITKKIKKYIFVCRIFVVGFVLPGVR